MKFKAKLAQLSVRGLAGPVDVVAAAPKVQTRAEDRAADASHDATHIDETTEFGSRTARLRARIDALRLAKPGASTPVHAQAEWQKDTVETPAGTLCRVINVHADAHCQGQTPILPCLRVSGAQLMALTLDEGLEQVSSRRLLFVDTETTGLAGGSGTVPFLIGVGYFVGEALTVEQWMLRRLGEEGPMLARLAECLDQADAIVTYNGKSFDWPLLRNRFILNRIKMPPPKPHIDLLHCARRLFKRRVPEGAPALRGGLKLSQVERDVLGFHRVGDIDGAHIPERYFAYLRGESAELLTPVLEHNRHDLVSLAALLGHIAPKLEDTDVAGSADEHLNLAHIALRGQHKARAQAFAERAAVSSKAHVKAEAALLLAQMFLRQRAYVEAEAALRAGLCTKAGPSMLQSALHLALAKLLEHRMRQPAQALKHAAYTQRAEGVRGHTKRLSRLQRKAVMFEAKALGRLAARGASVMTTDHSAL